MGSEFEPAEPPGDPEPTSPTSGERVLYALGQLYRLWHAGKLPAHPSRFDIADLARIVGVAADLEFVTEDFHGTHYHFADEVLYVNPEHPFPWRLLSVWEWAAEQELNAFWAEGWD